MAWVSPRTWAAGELVTASLFNSQLKDQLNALPSICLSKSADYTVLDSDMVAGQCVVLVTTTSSNVTITLPSAAVGSGKRITVILVSATYASGRSTGIALISPAGSETANGITTDIPLYLRWDHCSLISDGSNWVIESEQISLLAEYTLVGALTFTHNVWTPLRYDTANVDTASCLGTTGDSDGSFIVPAGMAGYYQLECAFRWATSPTWTITPAGFFSQFFKGVTGGATLAEFQCYVGNYHTGGRINNTMVAQPLLAAGDYISPSSKQVTGVDYVASVLPERQMFWARLIKRTYA